MDCLALSRRAARISFSFYVIDGHDKSANRFALCVLNETAHFFAGARMEASSTITSTSTFPARSNTSVIRKLS